MKMRDIDTLLKLLQNPTRRRILRRLTLEDHYPLQLAKELKLSTQAVSKQLDLLERHGLIKCKRIESDRGPKRKCYYAVEAFSLRLGVGPNLFEAKVSDLLSNGEDQGVSQPRPQRSSESKADELKDIRAGLKNVNKRISSMDEEMSRLLRIKDRQMEQANRLIQQLLDRYEEREILHYILVNEEHSLSDMSKSLGLREEVIRNALKRLSKMNLIELEEVLKDVE